MADIDVVADGIRVRLAREESDVLRGVLDELRAVLRGEIDRSDAVIGRLFPDAYDSTDEADSYRELTTDSLTRDKLEALEAVRDALGPRGPVDTVVEPEPAEAWLRVLTDLRLAIGTRMDVDEDAMSRQLDPSDPNAPALSIIHWLGWITEQVVAALRATEGT